MNATSMRAGCLPTSSRTRLISSTARPVPAIGLPTSRRLCIKASAEYYPSPGSSGPVSDPIVVPSGGGPPKDPIKKNFGGSGGSGAGGAGGGDWQEKLPPPPSGFSWAQILTFVAVVAAVAVSPLPSWLQENFFPKDKSVSQVAKENVDWAKTQTEKAGEKVKQGAKDVGDKARESAKKAEAAAKDAAEKAKETAKEASEKAKHAAAANVYQPAKEGTESLVSKVEHAGADVVQATKNAASSVGRTLHVLPDRAKEAKDKAIKEGDKAAKKANKEAKKAAGHLGDNVEKKWLVYSGIGLAVVAASAVVAEEVLRKKKSGGGDKPKKVNEKKPNTFAATTAKDPVPAVRPATTGTTTHATGTTHA